MIKIITLLCLYQIQIVDAFFDVIHNNEFIVILNKLLR